MGRKTKPRLRKQTPSFTTSLEPNTINCRALNEANEPWREHVQRPKSDWEIGRAYERYLGYLRESSGWRVVFHGALMGYADFGRDLIVYPGPKRRDRSGQVLEPAKRNPRKTHFSAFWNVHLVRP